MLPTEIRIGHVFHYSYLWHWQQKQGREEGVKDRPCLVLALVETKLDGTHVVRVVPITHVPPDHADDAIEIPAGVKHRLQLDQERSWIILTESNRFNWPGPDIRAVESADGYFGAISPALFAEVKRRFVDLARSGRHG